MEILYSDYKADALHHAYLFPKSEDINSEIIKFVEGALSMPTRGNPDVNIFNEASFTISSARELKELEARLPLSGAHKIFIVSFDFITREAENALLKVLEEPSAGTHFFFMTEAGDVLLPTLRSRLYKVDVVQKEKSVLSGVDIDKFLHSSEKERIRLISKLVEEKDKARAIIFLNSLESELYQMFKKGEIKESSIFKSIRDARSYMSDRAPSVKMLLEHVALSVPTA